MVPLHRSRNRRERVNGIRLQRQQHATRCVDRRDGLPFELHAGVEVAVKKRTQLPAWAGACVETKPSRHSLSANDDVIPTAVPC